MTQTAHCPEHGLERVAQAWAERWPKTIPGLIVRVSFDCGQPNIVVMSLENFKDVRK